MRHSNITQRLRAALSLLDASDAEFRAIYRIHQPFAEILYPSAVGGSISFSPDQARQRNDAQKQVADQLKAALGEQRAADYARANNFEYQNLHRLAQNANLSPDALNRTYDLRLTVAQESMRIQDSKLSPADRTAALQALVTSTKAQIAGHLGSTLADTYVKNLSWLSALERGYAIRLNPDGTSMTYMMGPSTPPPTR